MTTDKQQRKACPVTTGVLDYFPDAITEVAHVSFIGNEQHNKGQPMHWAREKSKDHSDCISRHLIERGTLDDDGLRHSAKVAWRALAMLQLEIEKDQSRGITIRYKGKPTLIQDLPLEALIQQDSAWQPEGQSVVTESLTKPKPLVYLSGPMRHMPGKNYAAFDAAKEVMESHGYEVISPADMDRLDKGPQPNWVYVERDVAALCRIAREARPGSLIVTIAGWQESVGARAEIADSEWLEIPIRHIKEFA